MVLLWVAVFAIAQAPAAAKKDGPAVADNGPKAKPLHDSIRPIDFNAVTVVAFKSPKSWSEYHFYKERVEFVLPYVRIAKQLYEELQEKEQTSKKKDFKKYRKNLEKNMREKFEKELKDLTVTQGKVLFKLINRETGNNCYKIISELKGPAAAWFFQIIAKRYGYDLKKSYNPEEEKMIETIIEELGPAYKMQ